MTMSRFELTQFDPVPLAAAGMLDGRQADANMILLDIQSKYLFVDDAGQAYHEYYVPGTPDIQNCGGYVDKVIQYRNPDLLEYLERTGVSRQSFSEAPFPLLRTRSPQLDLILFGLIDHLARARPGERVSLLDHGCTVAEHYDLLDVMLRAASGGKQHAADLLAYCGIDKSSMLLTIARLLHPRVAPEHLRLVRAEGSAFEFEDREFDLSLSVGVVNHVANPVDALRKLLAATRVACVLAIWVTLEGEGFWAFNHSGVPNYFFSRDDLSRLLSARPDMRALSAGFTPETEASQARSYVGIGAEKTKALGSYHLVFTSLKSPPFEAQEVPL